MHPELEKLSPADWNDISEPLMLLNNCTLCPRNCHANRFSGPIGYCKTGSGFYISSIVIHKGEEPPIGGENGICNVFFTHCNIQCRFCQNHQISRNQYSVLNRFTTIEEVVSEILNILDSGIEALGFVSPSHHIPQMMCIIRCIRKLGRKPLTIFNSNGYDSVSSIEMLEDYIDVYLPDFKYSDSRLALELSDAKAYPEIATLAIREMFKQKGAQLLISGNGQAYFGILVRHLILPGYLANSFGVLDLLSNNCSTNLTISLMSQFNPVPETKYDEQLGRNLYINEYEQIKEYFFELGFHNGFFQEPESSSVYNPDFTKLQPFSE